MTPISPATLENLLTLSGMKYKSGYFTPEEWQQKTGINPRTLPGYIAITPNTGLCIWTDKAERAVEAHHAQTINNWHALGIAAE